MAKKNTSQYMNKTKKQPPEIISRRFILHSTGFDIMSNEERKLVFDAYQYSHKKEIYELVYPELLTDSIIEKIIR